MNEYDFKNLDPIEFEALSNDLMSKEFRVHVERFKRGRDQGIDGMFYQDSGGMVLIQAKHYSRYGF